MADATLTAEQRLIVHYGSTRGAACGVPSGSLALSTSLKLVNCPECIELKRPRTPEEDRILNQNLDRVEFARGPRAEWGNWREKRSNRIANPRRNKAALQLGAPKKPEST